MTAATVKLFSRCSFPLHFSGKALAVTGTRLYVLPPRRHASSTAADFHDRQELKGKVALVTGSTSGIGLGIANFLAKYGCHVIINGFADPDIIEQIKRDITSRHGVQASFVGGDLSQVGEVERLVQEVQRLHPPGPDILVNNAGVQHVSPVEDFPVAKWDLMLAVMLSAPFHLTRLLLPAMRQRGWGRIVNVSSVHGLIASPFKSAYVSAKHGVIGLTKTVALETAGSGVTCNAVCPGWVETSLFTKQIKDRAKEQEISEGESRKITLQTHPSGESVQIYQVAEMVAFICSDAGAQMTGSAITMDGGWTAR